MMKNNHVIDFADDGDDVILPNVDEMAEKLDQVPQAYNLDAFKRHNEKVDAEKEKNEPGNESDPTDPTTSPAYVEAKAIATTLDVGVAFLCCYMIVGTNDFSQYRADKQALNEVINAWVPVVEKYQWKLGPEIALAAIMFGAYAPVVGKAIATKKANDIKKAAAAKQQFHPNPTEKQNNTVDGTEKEG